MEGQFTLKQYRALAVLASGGTNEQAALEAGCSISSVEKWKRQPNFAKALNESIVQVYNASLARLSLISMRSVIDLEKNIVDPDTTTRNRIAAIALVLGSLDKGKQMLLEERLQELYEGIRLYLFQFSSAETSFTLLL